MHDRKTLDSENRIASGKEAEGKIDIEEAHVSPRMR
jgi:hypothetical protein